MGIVWEQEPVSVATVRAGLHARGRSLAYTTVLTVMERLARKEIVKRERRGRAYLYQPRVSREEMRERALDRLVRNYFGNLDSLRRYLDQDRGGQHRRADLETAIDASLL
jgi:predicted transcriptional regulator